MIHIYTKNQTYNNVLLFSIIIETIIIFLFSVLSLPSMISYIPFIATLGGTLVLIIVWALIKASRKANDQKKKKEILQYTRAHNVACPDYFTRVDGSKCKNEYITPNNTVKYEFLDPKTQKPLNDVDVKSIFGDFSLQHVCSNSMTEEPYTRFPWTAVSPQCSAFNIMDEN